MYREPASQQEGVMYSAGMWHREDGACEGGVGGGKEGLWSRSPWPNAEEFYRRYGSDAVQTHFGLLFANYWNSNYREAIFN